MKQIGLTRKEYYDAISEALDAVSAMGDRKESAGGAAFCRILAWVWDATSANATLDDFNILGDDLFNIALPLFIGRLNHGRPIDHVRREEIEGHYMLFRLSTFKTAGR